MSTSRPTLCAEQKPDGIAIKNNNTDEILFESQKPHLFDLAQELVNTYNNQATPAALHILITTTEGVVDEPRIFFHEQDAEQAYYQELAALTSSTPPSTPPTADEKRRLELAWTRIMGETRDDIKLTKFLTQPQ